MKFLEKDLEEIIFNASQENRDGLKEKGLEINGTLKRQLRIGNYGVADLVTAHKEYYLEYDKYTLLEDVELCTYTTYPKLIITVYELKKDKVGISAYLQAVKYTRGIMDYISNRKDIDTLIEFRIVLIGSEIDNSGSFTYLNTINENLELYTYEYGLNGIEFNTHGNYSLKIKGF